MREFTGSGRTVLFATHYLQEADDFADRVVVVSRGRIVADGTGAQIKATVTGRTISTVVSADPADLAALPGVNSVERQGPRMLLHCSESDVALRALLIRFDDAEDIEITAGDLEDAFLELTAANLSTGEQKSWA
jgi:ABC-2 type transport system ATP-binding protein